MIYLKQSTASQSVLLGPFIDDTDGKTAETGLTIANTDIRISANGGNMADKTSGGGTHDEAGWYSITLDATDTATVGRLQISVHVSGALPVWVECVVLEEAIYDALFGASAAGFNSSGQVSLLTATQASIDAIETDTGTTLQGELDAIQAAVITNAAGADIAADIIAVKADTAAVLVDTADMQPKIGTPAADIAADIAAVKVDTAATLVDTGTTLPSTLATIDGIVDAILVDTGTTIPATITTAQNDLDILTGADGVNLLSATQASIDAIEVDTSTTLETHLTDIKGGTFSGATDSLESIRDRGDAAWTTGAGGSSPTVEEIRAEMDSNSTQLAAILLDTGTTLPATLATIDGNVDAILVDTGTTIPATISTAQADLDIITGADGVNLLTATQASIDAIETDTGTTIPATIATVDSNVDAILVDTGTTLPATLATIDSNVDAVLVDTGTTLPATLATIDGNVDAILVDTAEIGAAGAGLTAIWTTAMTESYGTDGSALTGAELLYLINAHVGEHANSGTTKTLKKLDGSTTAGTFTYDDAANPTSITRAT